MRNNSKEEAIGYKNYFLVQDRGQFILNTQKTKSYWFEWTGE